jgi:hydrogenase maturation factor
MSQLGKLTATEFERTIAPRLGAPRPEVLVGPGIGRDSAIVRAGAGRVMALTTDPLSLIPALGATDSARLACHLLASDLWTTGIPPAYASVNFNLPPSLGEAEFSTYWTAMSDEFARLGIAVVAGHTGRYAGCDLTIIGAATLVGLGDEGRYVGPSFVQPADRVIVTKDCALEATAIAARLFPQRLAARLDEEQMARARGLLDEVSVVADCRAALRVGVRDRGVAALHDATEGGVLGGLVELARASGYDLRVSREAIPLSPEARAACELFGIDPYWTLSEGTLIVVTRPGRALETMAALEEEGIHAFQVGEVVSGDGKVWLTEADGSVSRIAEPLPDPYWDAYDRAVRESWS